MADLLIPRCLTGNSGNTGKQSIVERHIQIRSNGALNSLFVDRNLNAYFTNYGDTCCLNIRGWHFVRRTKVKIPSRYFVREPRYLITEGMLLPGIRDLDVYLCP